MVRYEPEVLTVLSHCGWSPDRYVDARQFEARAAELAIWACDRALQFLRRYAELDVVYRGYATV